jgi:hypothetical protein
VTPAPKIRTQHCTPEQARKRLAATDAACCSALGIRPRGDDHNDAADVLERVAHSADAVMALRRLLSLKNDAQYGLVSVSATKRNSALRQARKLVEFGEQVIAR